MRFIDKHLSVNCDDLTLDITGAERQGDEQTEIKFDSCFGRFKPKKGVMACICHSIQIQITEQVAIKTKNNNNNNKDQFLLTIAITPVSEVDFFRLP